LLPGKTKRVLVETLWKQHIVSLLLILAGVFLAVLLGSFVQIPDVLAVCTIVALAGAYNLFLEKV